MALLNFYNTGFDYGIKPLSIIVGNMEMGDYFRQAKCIAILYASTKEPNGELIPCKMGFLFQNEIPGQKFFEVLLDWVEKSNNDGDSVSIDFIETNSGGYALAIGPETKRFIKRIVPTHMQDRITPITIVQTQFKEIDVLGQNYLNFKANHNKAKKIAIACFIGSPGRIEKESERHFYKTEFNFYNENEIPSDSLAKSYQVIKKNNSVSAEEFPPPPNVSIVDIAEKRISQMKELLPITYNKLSNLWLGEIQKKLAEHHESIIIKQAICNLTVFERIKRIKEPALPFPKEEFPDRILDYLVETYETFGSYYPPDDFYTEEVVLRQIANDKMKLDNFLSQE